MQRAVPVHVRRLPALQSQTPLYLILTVAHSLRPPLAHTLTRCIRRRDSRSHTDTLWLFPASGAETRAQILPFSLQRLPPPHTFLFLNHQIRFYTPVSFYTLTVRRSAARRCRPHSSWGVGCGVWDVGGGWGGGMGWGGVGIAPPSNPLLVCYIARHPSFFLTPPLSSEQGTTFKRCSRCLLKNG